jgi:hypothetical protein
VSPAQGSSGAGTCPVGSSTCLSMLDSYGGATCHQLGAAPSSRRRSASGAPRVTGSGQPRAGMCPVGSSTCLPAQDSSGGTACPRSSRPEEKHRAELLRNRALGDFFSTHRPAQGSSGGSVCPRGSGPNENRQADAEDLAKSGRCKATPI